MSHPGLQSLATLYSLCSRFVKFSMPNIPDFETLFSQVQLFISTCNGEHIRYATDTCKLNHTFSWFVKCFWLNISNIGVEERLLWSQSSFCRLFYTKTSGHHILFVYSDTHLIVAVSVSSSSCWSLSPVNKCPCRAETGMIVGFDFTELWLAVLLLK